MPLSRLVAEFDLLKKNRRLRKNADLCLSEVGHFAIEAHKLITDSPTLHRVAWHGTGEKFYSVFAEGDKWSRGVNDREFIWDPYEFDFEWQQFEEAVVHSAGQKLLLDFDSSLANRVVYTAVMSWAAAVDIYQPSNGLAGTFLEMLVGPTIALLSDREESGAIKIAVPEQGSTETVTVDVSFHGSRQSLAVPTKISTRERISQVYVHSRILETAFPYRYKTVLVAGNETNAVYPRGAVRSVENMGLKETLVPGTIALYQKYISAIDGLYYLDPPKRYLDGSQSGLPHIGTVGELLTEDLAGHLLPPK